MWVKIVWWRVLLLSISSIRGVDGQSSLIPVLLTRPPGVNRASKFDLVRMGVRAPCPRVKFLVAIM